MDYFSGDILCDDFQKLQKQKAIHLCKVLQLQVI